jgi:hypothetical protein
VNTLPELPLPKARTRCWNFLFQRREHAAGTSGSKGENTLLELAFSKARGSTYPDLRLSAYLQFLKIRSV